MSQVFNQISAVFAELKLSIIRAKVKSGIVNAKVRKIGRPTTATDDIPAILYKHSPAYVSGQLKLSEFVRVYGLSRPTVYKCLKMIH